MGHQLSLLSVIDAVLERSYEDRWELFGTLFNSLGADIVKHTEKRGFDPKNEDISRLMILQISEIIEAHEAHRCNNPESEKCPGFKHLEEEMADAVLRIMIDSAAKGWRTAEACIAKDAYNQTRSYLHGNKKF